MKEISLHILDIVGNSIKADAKIIEIEVNENTESNIFEIRITDNGNGMTSDVVAKAADPFFTTRTTRNVGMGISLLKSAAERCEGAFEIKSSREEGTVVYASFRHGHIDRAPLGNMADSIITILSCNKNFELIYKHIYNDRLFIFKTEEIKKILQEVDIKSSHVLAWLKDYIKENINELKIVK